ncbi:MAG: type II toxin-antitoxin system VapC family toxin [Acetobacteraceae bacterium]|nr:type II toxin-antitoxin system VapC family toxin [Acetobacteraceae bacterium]
MYLVDTNVVSELRKPRPHPVAIAWLRGVSDRDLFLSAVTVGELQAGVENLRAKDKSRAEEIEAWVDQIAGAWNVLPMDTKAFRHWALLMQGRPGDLIADAMIAATAHVHGLTVVTRNIRDFATLSVPTLDPFVPV